MAVSEGWHGGHPRLSLSTPECWHHDPEVDTQPAHEWLCWWRWLWTQVLNYRSANTLWLCLFAKARFDYPIILLIEYLMCLTCLIYAVYYVFTPFCCLCNTWLLLNNTVCVHYMWLIMQQIRWNLISVHQQPLEGFIDWGTVRDFSDWQCYVPVWSLCGLSLSL